MTPGGKAMPTQTGIHVPLIVHCPSRFDPAVADGIVEASDFYPTLLDLADAPPQPGKLLDGISFLPQLLGQPLPRRDAAFFWYDPRPGWDKERFARHVFALNQTHKLFRDGRLFRIGTLPLEEIFVQHDQPEDSAERAQLLQVISEAMAGVEEPPLVDAYGIPLEK